jgi:hypothetical protein
VDERAAQLRDQLDSQRADISRTVEQIENRVVPGRVLQRRRYRMRRSMMDWRDRLFGNDEPDYPEHWYAPPAAAMGPGFGGQPVYGDYGTYGYGDDGGFGDDGGRSRVGEARDRASDAAHQVSDRASGMAHGMSDRASGMAHGMSDRASGMAHGISDRAQHAPEAMRRQTQGNPMALGMVAFGAGLLLATMLPESRREKQLAQQVEPGMRRVVDEAGGAAGEVAADLREEAQHAAEQLKETASREGQALKNEAVQEGKQARRDVGSAAQS